MLRIFKNYLLGLELRASCFFLLAFLYIQNVTTIKAITRRTTSPDIKPANCDGERRLLLFEVGDVPKLGAENDQRSKDFSFIATCDIKNEINYPSPSHLHNKQSSYRPCMTIKII